MTSPFDAIDDASPGRLDRLTLVNGRTFQISAPDGSLRRPGDGIVFEDLRMLSKLELRVEDADGSVIACQMLGISVPSPFHAVVASRPDPDRADGHQELYIHRQWIGRGARHDVEIHNTGPRTVTRTVVLHLDTDFAHVFDMKAGRPGPAAAELVPRGGRVQLLDPDDDGRVVEVCAAPAPTVDPVAKELRWSLPCPPGSQATVSVSFEPCWDGHRAGIAFPIGSPPAHAWPATRLDRWRRLAPSVTTDDPRLAVTLETCVGDLASLRIFDRHHADRVVVAAGAPWFMTLFGRDSLITSWMALPFLPELAVGTLETLAELQGVAEHPDTEEQPGKILHELRRHGGDAAFARRGRYYGTVDATPLFVMVVGEALRWRQLDADDLRRRWTSVVAAIGWVRRSLAVGGGFLRYRRSTDVGLTNQGWKDSWDGISYADGRLPTGPVALAEVQGYAFAALRSGALVAELVGDEALDPGRLRREADELAERFESAFWMESHSCYAVGVEGDGHQIDSVTTNPGHAVWTGIADPDRADRYLDRILDDDLFTGWGLRTLSPTCARYDPLSYHNGSVWPHDTAIVAAGAARLGRHDVVERLYHAALDVAGHTAGRPPELFAGVHRDVIDLPVPYPSSCSPQAWSSASTLLYLRSLLRLDPPRPGETAPRADALGDPGFSRLRGIRVGDRRWAAATDGSGWRCTPDPMDEPIDEPGDDAPP